MVRDQEIIWYDRKLVLQNKHRFNFYITTDFATKDKQANDYNVISVWAYNANGDWLYVDGICKKQLMDKTVNDLFRLVQIYKPQQVGIEVSGQQQGFVSWLQNEMLHRNTYFNFATDKNDGAPGIRPNTDKMVRFNIVVPWFKTHKIWFPEQLKETPELMEAMGEIRLITQKGMKSKHDDFVDTISMLGNLTPWKPSEDVPPPGKEDMWDDEEDMDPDASDYDSYIV
jgi:predicted phage terminase large subunit-like protein